MLIAKSSLGYRKKYESLEPGFIKTNQQQIKEIFIGDFRMKFYHKPSLSLNLHKTHLFCLVSFKFFLIRVVLVYHLFLNILDLYFPNQSYIFTFKLLLLLRLSVAYSIIQMSLYLQVNIILVIYKSRNYSIYFFNFSGFLY